MKHGKKKRLIREGKTSIKEKEREENNEEKDRENKEEITGKTRK